MKKQNDGKAFKLSHEPIDFQMSVHFQNMIATYGEAKVKKFVKEVFSNKGAKRVRKTG